METSMYGAAPLKELELILRGVERTRVELVAAIFMLDSCPGRMTNVFDHHVHGLRESLLGAALNRESGCTPRIPHTNVMGVTRDALRFRIRARIL
jgi:hypothetical protein